MLIVCSGGTILKVSYGKGGRGIWAIEVLAKGDHFESIAICENEDDEIYSDVVTLEGAIKQVYSAGGDWEEVA